jgi:hypothetical protein
MRAVLFWLRAMFAWRKVRCTGVWAYSENALTGQRAVTRVGTGYQPIDWQWLHRLPPLEPTPPRMGSGVFRP